MGEFMGVALAFPTVLFSFALVIVVIYWLLALLIGLDLDILDGDDVGAENASSGFLPALGLGGVPVTVVLSLLVVLAWFVSLAGSALVSGTAMRVLVLAVALGAAWLGTRSLVTPLRRVFASERAPSRNDFVGRMCVIRTGRVTGDFGQAEVRAADGSTAIVQVRGIDGDAPLRAGDRALIFDYDTAGEFFRVMPYDAGLDPERPLT
ncbi:OB-fold-containig protein [Bailinhaonella thermotolerans]|uniref:DUF1449 family protein n=1 Tax=Bailinhaonella thermotolerans TaxID=1070861 RepID=A0A3A4AYF3_9ACTN|nr:OB-fold-containig protein [Bailinhaonella thermotolerans]RJL24412.1 hypothetical protein D5H75_29170 [Bailinhaonella thermotolerans]